MKLKKRPKAGQCAAMRCLEPSQTSGLCERHAAEPVTGTALAPRQETSIDIPQSTREEIAAQAAETEEMIQLVAAFAVTSPETEAIANEGLKEAHAALVAREKERKIISSMIRAALKEWDAAYSVVTEPLERLKRAWKDKINAYREALEEAKKEAIEVAQNAETPEDRHEALVVASQAASNSGSRRYYYWTVDNFAEVPEEYKTTDDKKIWAVVRREKEATNIPGVKVSWRDDTVVPR